MVDTLNLIEKFEGSGVLELNLDHIAFGRGDDNAFNHHLTLELTQVGGDHLNR